MPWLTDVVTSVAVALVRLTPDAGVNADNLVWLVPGSGIRGLRSWGRGCGSKGQSFHHLPLFLPTKEETEARQRQHLPKDPSVPFFYSRNP